MRRLLLTAVLGGIAVLALAAPAHAANVKAIWGPPVFNPGIAGCPGPAKCSAFPVYRELGVDVYQFQLHFDEIAPTPPANPRNPADPAYKWPAAADGVVNDAAATGIQLAFLVQYSPPWANGGLSKEWVPNNKAFADFLYAASRRYPSVRKWLIWGEPMLGRNYQPMPPGRRSGPRRYGKLVDKSYVALKQASRQNQVIGGNTASFASSGLGRSASKFIQWMRLKNGRMPRMDLFGHNPFDYRFPRLKDRPIVSGFRGINDVDSLWSDLQAAYAGKKKGAGKKGKKGKGRSAGKRRKSQKVPRLWLSEYFVLSDAVFGDRFISRDEQARYVTAAYAMVRHLKYVAALGWFTLLDSGPPTNQNWGLMQADGIRKPAYFAYAAVP
jgi:hypothetical protein